MLGEMGNLVVKVDVKETWRENGYPRRKAVVVVTAAVRRRARLPHLEGKTTRDQVTGTRSRVGKTQSRETTTRNWVTTTWVRRMTGKERS
jgi:hypothetical protein